MRLSELVDQVAGFDKLPPREKIQLFAWYLHTHKGVEHFGSDNIRACFKELHLVPGEVGKYVLRMSTMNTPDLVRERHGFKLTRTVRAQLDAKYGSHPSMQAVSKLLNDLSALVPDMAEKVFLAEAIDCYRVRAYRACIVMVWNLAYSHLLEWILKDQTTLDRFNDAISRRYQSLKNVQIAKYDDFGDYLQERQVLEIANTANLYNSNVFKILKKELDRRNTAAHPSSVKIVQSQADDMVTDLINNVVLTLK
ncbi:hypothetical protein RA307_29345 [Xanthobacteraceae bacterium Astr-EGSB]|uniref:hypothetical protein n=1 Tax=Astrobacterium formosum TaxID=3069710 RepID=UPI0027B2764C|nr:hypothetical protein [Xanthobacteraceae bacterium Astr-EGSB]